MQRGPDTYPVGVIETASAGELPRSTRRLPRIAPSVSGSPERRVAVSRGCRWFSWVYTHPDLRAQIEHRTLQTITRSTSATSSDPRVTAASLRADVENTKAHNQRLRQQLRTLEQRLSKTLGHQVADQLQPDQTARPDDLRRELEAAHARAFELEEALADACEELDAVREINRELLAERNRPAR